MKINCSKLLLHTASISVWLHYPSVGTVLRMAGRGPWTRRQSSKWRKRVGWRWDQNKSPYAKWGNHHATVKSHASCSKLLITPWICRKNIHTTAGILHTAVKQLQGACFWKQPAVSRSIHFHTRENFLLRGLRPQVAHQTGSLENTGKPHSFHLGPLLKVQPTASLWTHRLRMDLVGEASKCVFGSEETCDCWKTFVWW